MLKTKQKITIEVDCFPHDVQTIQTSFQKIATHITTDNIKILGKKAKPSMNAKIKQYQLML